MGWMDVLYRSFDGMECGSGGGVRALRLNPEGERVPFSRRGTVKVLAYDMDAVWWWSSE